MQLHGVLIAGRYRLGPLLGEGASGAVHRARDERDARDVALKVLVPARAEGREDRARFVREARAAARLDHPGVVRILDAGETDDGRAFLVMELLEGHTLARELGRGPLAIWRALSVARDVARALGHGHARGVVHRDVKPSNVFLCASGVPKLLDLGLASVRGEAPLTAAGTALGTPAYMAPEQSIGMAVGPAADVYALGGVLFEMLTGRRAFEGSAVEVVRKHVREPPPSPSSFRPEVPPPVDALVLRFLAKQPADRPADGDAAADALDAELR